MTPSSQESEPTGQEGDGDPATTARSPLKIWALRALGLAGAALVWLALGDAQGLSPEGRWVAAVATLMALWWITEATPIAVTALLPILLFPMASDRSVAQVAAPYASPIIFLFLGGFLLAIAMQKWQLHRRVALLTLRRVGTSPRQIVLGLMLTTGFVSMWVSNTAATLMMLPIAFSVLTLVCDRRDETGALACDGASAVAPRELANFGACLMLAIAWSSSMGGVGTLLGSPPNAIVAGYIEKELGRQVDFLNWMLVGVPMAFSFILIAWLLMTRVFYRFTFGEVPGGRALIDRELAGLGRFSRSELLVTLVFCCAVFFWVVPGVVGAILGSKADLGWFGRLDDNAIALAAGLALFLLPGEGRGQMLLDWKDAESGVPWGVLVLFGGGLSLAGEVVASGLDGWLGAQVSGLGTLPILLLVIAVVTLIVFLSEVTSNTATAATFIPVLGAVALGIGADQMTLLIPAAFAATLAFMLPVGTPPNAIVFGTGAVTMGQMVRGGFILNLVGIVLITFFCWLLGGVALGLRL
ncbi:sodium-dependent dicarboxylate transporter 2/3/5 [Sphingobium sp. B2D3A]|uniref:SLC13 family permease n=1 Tax=unclassified Sphingobium TaxID=2611147 RepID=UPI0022246F9D|nr:MULTISPECIES: DASS family sodium-coupled anion symporter [unclassified Sphingobium]MCW2336020.1 sodium-dependent dicarboxylate transporter 2/3/5 [Sphingobium sp. B2D3A]MCW2385779.1 sodium-dependent dicarboxylate transporter 2/3/5 [Sphingobium sp. B2D3D]